MDKYDGCNKVECSVSEADKHKRVVKSGTARFVIKAAVAAAAIAALFVINCVPALEPVREAVRSVFCYDVFGRKAFGGMPIFG